MGKRDQMKKKEDPFLKYRNPDPHCTFQFNADLGIACPSYVFKVDENPKKDIVKSACLKCKYYKKQPDRPLP